MKKNRKGFTLVELLAVIVVLAIIMIIAIPNVLESMTTARKNSFKLFGQDSLNKAIAQYQTDILTGTTKTCYTISELRGNSSGSYKGYVTVTITAGADTTFAITYSDGSNYSATGATYQSLESDYSTTNTGGIKAEKNTTIANTCPTTTP